MNLSTIETHLLFPFSCPSHRILDLCLEKLFFFNHLLWFLFSSLLFQEDLVESSSDEDEAGLQDEKKSGLVVDMEDLGNIMNSARKAKVRLHPLAH